MRRRASSSAHLLTDVAALSALLYLSGGSANPFVSLYLVPLVIAAVALPAAFAWAMAAVTVTCYGLLFYFYVPLPALHLAHDFGLHLFGMWVNFLVSAVIIAWLVARMAQAIRTRDAQIARQREDALRNERIVALGTLAAGAAHELGTPLSTMAVVLGEMAHEHATDGELGRDIATLRTQVDVCKHTITRMVAAAGQARAEGGGAQPVDEFLRETRGALAIDQTNGKRDGASRRCNAGAEHRDRADAASGHHQSAEQCRGRLSSARRARLPLGSRAV